MPPRLSTSLLAAIPLALAAQVCLAAAPISLCAEPAEGSAGFRPLRDSQGKVTGYTGFSVEFLTRLFADIGREVRIVGELSWSRCLLMVERGDIDFAFGAYYNEERAKRFTYSAPFRTLTPQIFYLAVRPIKVKTIDDLRHYRGCGMYGSSYRHYGLDENAIDRGANNYETLVMKLKAGRCDYIPEELEVVANLSDRNGQHFLADAELRHQGVEGAKAPQRHLVTTKDGRLVPLLQKINPAINALLQSGEAERMWQRNILSARK